MMKNTFYFTSKALFVLKIFNFLSWIFVQVENGLIRMIRLISKFIMSQPGKEIILIHISPNILRSKDNWTMKFGQLVKYKKHKKHIS